MLTVGDVIKQIESIESTVEVLEEISDTETLDNEYSKSMCIEAIESAISDLQYYIEMLKDQTVKK